MAWNRRIAFRHRAQLHTSIAQFLDERRGPYGAVGSDVVSDGFKVGYGLFSKS